MKLFYYNIKSKVKFSTVILKCRESNWNIAKRHLLSSVEDDVIKVCILDLVVVCSFAQWTTTVENHK
jgi:hypothetical protein